MEPTGYGQKIMVGIDGSPGSTAALAWAMGDAALRNTSVEALHVWQTPSLAYSAPGFIPFSEAEIEDQAWRALESSLCAISTAADISEAPDIPEAPDVKVLMRVDEGNPSELLARATHEPDAAMLVVGARGHGGVAGLLLGSVSHSLTHTSCKPLVIVPKDWSAISPPDVPPRIVVGVDGSRPADDALRWAAEEAVLRGTPLEVVMVWPSPVLPSYHPNSCQPDPYGRRQEEPDRYSRARQALERAVGRVDTGAAQLELSVVEGSPARTLVRVAGGAEMLVVGTRGFGRAHEAVSGSVSHACSHRATVPVAVIPHAKMGAYRT